MFHTASKKVYQSVLGESIFRSTTVDLTSAEILTQRFMPEGGQGVSRENDSAKPMTCSGLAPTNR